MFALGTVQLGVSYGVNNKEGLPDSNEVNDILELAWQGGVRWLDTASAYGLSEERIGSFLAANPDKNFSVVTKLPADLADATAAQSSLSQSLKLLRLRRVDCLMLHNIEHIPRLGSDLGKFLLKEKQNGSIAEIGASVYSISQLREVANYPFVTAVQIPANVFDQRFNSPEIVDILASRRVFIRSVYLQGLLLMAEQEAAKAVPAATNHLRQWHRLSDSAQVPPEILALGWVRRAFPAAIPLIGCESAVQLRDNFEVWDKSQIDEQTFESLSSLKCDIEDVILPMKWKRN